MSSVSFNITTASFDFRFSRPNQPKRAAPEEPETAPADSSKKARVSEIAQQAIQTTETPLEAQSSPVTLPSARPKLILKSDEIADKYHTLLKNRSVLRRINLGKITASSKIDESEYTYFETAIFCNNWTLAKKILLNDLNDEISVQRNKTLITEFYILAWAAEKQEWDFVSIFLQRGLSTFETDLLLPSSDSLKIERVIFNYFEPIAPAVELTSQFGISLNYTIATALRAERIDLINIILEKYRKLPTSCWKNPLFLFLTKKMWHQAQIVLCAHPELASLTLAKIPYAFSCIEEWKNATILLLLCAYARLNIIYSIVHQIDHSIFFKPNSDHPNHRETTPFCLLALKGEREIVSYLLECVNEDSSYDVMRTSKYSYHVSIFGYAVETGKWWMALTILQFHHLTKTQSPEFVQFIYENDYLLQIASRCFEDEIKDNLLRYCNYYLSFHPLRTEDATPSIEQPPKSTPNVVNPGLDSWDRHLRSLILEDGV